MINIIALTLDDQEWVQTIIDLEDMDEYEILAYNLRYRLHLSDVKKALILDHLRWEI